MSIIFDALKRRHGMAGHPQVSRESGQADAVFATLGYSKKRLRFGGFNPDPIILTVMALILLLAGAWVSYR